MPNFVILWKGSYQPYLQTIFFIFKNFGFLNFNNFLALLDYVSRAHEIEIRPSYLRLSLPAAVGGLDFLSCFRSDFFDI